MAPPPTPSAAVPAPAAREGGALFPAPRRVFPLTPRSPRLLTPPRLRIPPPQPALELFNLPHPHRFIPIMPPEAAGGIREGKRFSRPVPVTVSRLRDRGTEPFAEWGRGGGWDYFAFLPRPRRKERAEREAVRCCGSAQRFLETPA